MLAQRGERDEALELLRQALAAEPEYGKYLETDTDLEPLRADPRFNEVLGPRSE